MIMYSEAKKADKSDTPPLRQYHQEHRSSFVASLFTKLKYSWVVHYKC